jgi:hypothetical protein
LLAGQEHGRTIPLADILRFLKPSRSLILGIRKGMEVPLASPSRP